MSASNGFRQTTAPSRKEQYRQITTELQNLSMATRISQMMMQKLAGEVERLDRDIAKAMGLLNDLQYRTLATIEVGNIDKEKLDVKADELKLVDFNSASDKDDLAKGLLVADVVEATSIVVITSEAPADQGIFRSKFKVSDCGRPDLEKELLGRRPGDKFTFKLNDVDHQVELLAVRNEPAKPVEASVVQNVVVNAAADNALDVTPTLAQ